MTERGGPRRRGTAAGARASGMGAGERRWGETWLAPGFVVVTALACLLLAAMLVFVYRAIGNASVLLARGEGAQFADAVQEALRRGPRPPQAATLVAVLARKEGQGLRYVALLRPDGSAVEIDAGSSASPLGDAALAALRPMQPVRLGDRMRMLTGPPGPGPGGAPPPPPGARPYSPLPLPPPPPPPPPPRPGRPPFPPPGRELPGRRPPGPGPLRLVLEFEPVAARQLLALARQTILAGALALPAFVGCAVLLAYLVRQRNRLVRRLEQDRRLAALGEMSAVLAHEIRNPLASLKGHAQLLARSLDGDAARSAKAELVVREAVRLQTLAGDLLEFAGSAPAERRAADPAALLRESAEAVDAERIVLALDAAPRTWALDAPRLRQALTNVLRNAVQASPDGATVDAAAFVERDHLVFEVRDHGAGIPAGEEQRIFEPFHTRKVRGTGLGLSIARQVVEQQGGSIAAANARDGGAVFRIEIARA